MSAGDRFKGWIEGLSEAWKERLRGWLGGVLGFGAEVFMDILARSMTPKLQPLIKTLEDTGKVPPELQPILDEIKNPTGESAAAFGLSASGPIIGGAIGRIVDAALMPLSYAVNSKTLNNLIAPQLLFGAELRGLLTTAQVDEWLGWLGYDHEQTDTWRALFKVILPSDVVGPVWLRDKTKWGKFWSELPKLGLSPEQIQLLEEGLFKWPTADQAITWMAREVFEEDMARKYGLDDESDKIDYGFMEKIGIQEDIARKHWRAHWQHASWSQIMEMLHRGAVTEQDVYDWFRLVEIPPYWRKGLTATMWDLPGRLEIRMMARYGLVDKQYVMDALKKAGLAEESREVVADMNIAMGVRTDLASRYGKGWITKEELATELVASGLSEQVRNRLYQYIVKAETGARTAAQKDLTLAQIIKGVKKGKISRAEGLDLITDMGYDMEEAQLILDIEIPEDVTDAAVKARELTKADILAGLEAGTINDDQAFAMLQERRYTASDARFILDVYQASIKPPAEPAQREISKADVVAAVKKGLITPTQGYQLLVRIGFSAEASNFILALTVEESPFSPLNFEEFKKLTRAWRNAQAGAVEEIPPEAQDMKLLQARAVAEGKNPMLEQQRVQIDTVRRRRRKLLITRDQEIEELKKLGVPADYITALVENDDTRLAVKKE